MITIHNIRMYVCVRVFENVIIRFIIAYNN